MTTNSRPFQASFTTSSALYRTAFAALLLAAMPTAEALALPTGGEVNGGSATISQNGPNMVINQTTDRAIIDWQSFNIMNGESTHFNQPGASSIAINRIHDGNPSQILGSLSANGKLVLINPNGVIFGAGSRVDVSSLIATTADIKNKDAMEDKMNFSIAGRPDASIINKGTITAAEGGLVALVAPSVRNDGVIQARSGAIRIGAAETFTVDFYGDNLYSFAVGQKTTKAGKDENGKAMDSAIENNGTISAQGGSILLTANAAKDIVTHAVNNKGVIEASSARMVNGTIVLDGGEGSVRVAGKVNASGKGAGEKGGNIAITGKNIELAAADIDASGSIGGGSVKIGGDYQGGGTLAHADTVSVDADSTINVSALESGNGGLAVVWSDLSTDFKGTILGTGGVNGGNGGVAEVSSFTDLNFEGKVDMSAAAGKAGSLLLDPTNITVGALQALAISGVLTTGTDVTISTSTAGAQAGNITVNNAIVSLGSGALRLLAHNNITVNDAIALLSGNITLTANKNGTGATGAISLNNTVSTLGSVIFNGKTVSVNGTSSVLAGGNITINNSGSFFSNTIASLNSLFGGISVNQSNAGGVATIQNAIDAIGTYATNAKVNLGAGVFNQAFHVVGKNNFTVNGQGMGVTILKPTDLSGEPTLTNGTPWLLQTKAIALAKDGNNVTISNLSTDGSLVANIGGALGFEGVGFHNASGTASNLDITGSAMPSTGFHAVADSTQGHTAQTVNVNNVTSKGNSWSALAAIGNNLTINITGGTFDGTGSFLGALDLTNGSRGSVTGATLTSSAPAVVSFVGAHDYTLTGNTITGNGSNTGIADQGPASGVPATNNITLTNNTISNVKDGITANGASNWTITGGTISGTGTGIQLLNGTNTQTVSGVKVNGFKEGIVVENTDNAHIKNNFVTATATGIRLTNSDKATVAINEVRGPVTGLLIEDSNGAVVEKNDIAGSYYGVLLINDDNVTLTKNIITNNGSGFGIQLRSISNASFTGNSITGNGLGNGMTDAGVAYGMTGSKNITLTDNSFSNLRNGVWVESGENWNIRGGSITGMGTGTGLGVYFHNTTGTNSISGVNVSNTKTGTWLQNSAKTTVASNIFTNTYDGIYLNNGETTVTDNKITNTTHGITSDNGNDNILTANIISNATDMGIRLFNSARTLVKDNIIGATGAGIGLLATNSDKLTATKNTITAAHTGIALDNSDNALINHNGIQVPTGTGVYATASNGLTLDKNTIAARDYSLLLIASDKADVKNNIIINTAGFAIQLRGLTNSSFTNNTLTGTGGNNGMVDAGVLYGATGSKNITLTDNDFTNFKNGVWSESGENWTITGGKITGGSPVMSAGVYLHNNTLTNRVDGVTFENLLIGTRVINTTGTAISNNFYSNVVHGIALNTDNAMVTNNKLDTVTHGITVDGKTGNNDDLPSILGASFPVVGSSIGTEISGNKITNASGTGIRSVRSDNTVVSNNTVSGSGIGLFVLSSNALASTDNVFTNNAIGVGLQDSNEAVLTNDIFTGNTLGIRLDNSQSTIIDGATLSIPSLGEGIEIANGSGGTLVSRTSLTGGSIGVIVDGAGSSMQFADETNSFAGMDYYFVLANGAMAGETLDASGQFFEGTRAREFTFDQWALVESKTIDSETFAPIGDVFYTAFPDAVAFAGTNLSAIDDAERKRRSIYRQGLFSYAGRTLSSNLDETPFKFEVTRLSTDLSLLNRTNVAPTGPEAPQTPVGIANFFANLAPAAGGRTAATGATAASNAKMADQLAALSPSAGGNASPLRNAAALGGCGNNFLDAGQSVSFNIGTCQ